MSLLHKSGHRKLFISEKLVVGKGTTHDSMCIKESNGSIKKLLFEQKETIWFLWEINWKDFLIEKIFFLKN